MENYNVLESALSATTQQQTVDTRSVLFANLEMEKQVSAFSMERAKKNMLHEQISSVLSDALATLKKTGDEVRQSGR